MQSSLRDLLSWVWQIVLSWVASLTTGIYRPLCFGRSTNMVVKANDPEIAVRHGSDVKEEARPSSDQLAVLQIEEEKGESDNLLEPGARIDDDDDDEELSGNDGENEETKKTNAEAGAESTSDDSSGSSGDESSSEPSVVEVNRVTDEGTNNDSNDLSSTNHTTEDAVSSDRNDLDSSNPATENVVSSIVDENITLSILAAMQYDLFGSDEEEEETPQVQKRDSPKQDNTVNEDDEKEEEEEKEPKEDKSVVWLLKLGSKETYQKVLSPNYYCLNFKTAVALDFEKVNVAVKQLRRLIPWLCIGLKRREESVWLSLHPEGKLDIRMMYGGQNMWEAILEDRDEFNYREDNCLTTFMLMKASSCELCQTFMDSHSSTNLHTATKTSESVTEARENASDENSPTSSSSPYCDTITDGSCPSKDTSQTDEPSGHSASSNIDPLVNGDNNGAVLITNNDAGQSLNSSCVPENPDPEGTTSSCSPGLVRCNSNDSPDCNVATTENTQSDTSVPKTVNDSNLTNKNPFPHNYRLLFSVPHPLADEKSMHMICDVFLKELDSVISSTNSASGSSTDDKEINTEGTSKSDPEENAEGVNGDSGVSDSNDDTNESESSISESNQPVSERTDSNDSCTAEDSDEIRKASVTEQLAILSDILARTEEPKPCEENSNAPGNNNGSGIDRKSSHVIRTLDPVKSRNFINKCKSERISHISAFAICVDAAVGTTLTKSGVIDENENYQIGHSVRHYYNLDDLTDQEWHDHDPSEHGDDDEDNEECEYVECCRKPTVSFSEIPSCKFNGVWGRAKTIDSKCRAIQLNPRDITPQVIPLNAEHLNVDNSRFAVILQPEANFSVTNMNDFSKTFSKKQQSIESLSFGCVSPAIAFLMTNGISLNVRDGILNFSFYNQRNFFTNESAHEYADEIASLLGKAL